MNKKAIFSSYYLAPIEFYFYLNQYEEVIIDTYENFVKQSYRSRTYITGPNGVQCLSIPLMHVKKRKTVRQAKISNSENWIKNHWKSLEAAYRRSPYFEYYEDELLNFYQQKNKPELLNDFNISLQNKILELLDFSPIISYSKGYVTPTENMDDYRSTFSPKNKSEKLIFPEYNQVFSDRNAFAHNLSILDVLFNEGPNTINYINSIKVK